MSRKLTTEEFLFRAKKKHGNKYDYSLSIYKDYHSKVKIICPIHGIFEQVASSHFEYGCYKCGMERGTKLRTTTLDKFIFQANEKHNSLYNYSKVKYVNSETRIIIICPFHGEFEMQPNNHLDGKGCQICAIITRNLACEGKDNILSGEIPCEFYVLKLSGENEIFYKVGISRTLLDRHKTINQYYNSEIIYKLSDTLKNCVNLEQNLLKEFKLYKYIPKIKFGGYTECLSINPIENYFNLNKN